MTLGVSIYVDPKRRLDGAGTGIVLSQPSGVLTRGFRCENKEKAWGKAFDKIEKIVSGVGPVHAVCDDDLETMFYHVEHTVVETEPDSGVYQRARRIARARLSGVRLRKSVLVGDRVSSKRAQLIHIAAKENGYDERAIRKMLAEYGLVSTKEVTSDIFRAVLSKARSKTLASVYNDKVHSNHAVQ